MPILSGCDLSVELKRIPRQRLLDARTWFAEHGPPDAPPLPLSYSERENLKCGGIGHIVAWYARSLAEQGYDVEKHPSFDDYASGVMASEHAPWFIMDDKRLRKRFPPRPLDGLDGSMYWDPPKLKKSGARRRKGRAAITRSAA
jgi:hypothetical protein